MQKLIKSSGQFKIVIAGLIVLAATLPLVVNKVFAAQSTARAWGKIGTATATNAMLEVPFNPRFLRVCNTGNTNSFHIDFTDGVATADDDSTNVRVIPAAATFEPLGCMLFEFEDKNVLNTFTVGIIRISGDSAYLMQAWR